MATKKANPETRKLWNQKNPDKVRAHQIKIKFGISWEEYLGLFSKQHGSCAICKTPLELYGSMADRYKIAHVDHCHSSGKVRGLLCSKCNVGLGAFKDNQTALRNAADYLDLYI
jgi:hypothetical protein